MFIIKILITGIISLVAGFVDACLQDVVSIKISKFIYILLGMLLYAIWQEC